MLENETTFKVRRLFSKFLNIINPATTIGSVIRIILISNLKL